ncbi:hypothetical protein PSAC2689_20253 [Paraburkholderia sacchari]
MVTHLIASMRDQCTSYLAGKCSIHRGQTNGHTRDPYSQSAFGQPIYNSPLAVDLDGKLFRSDLLVEPRISFSKSASLRLYRPILWRTIRHTALKIGFTEDHP